LRGCEPPHAMAMLCTRCVLGRAAWCLAPWYIWAVLRGAASGQGRPNERQWAWIGIWFWHASSSTARWVSSERATASASRSRSLSACNTRVVCLPVVCHVACRDARVLCQSIALLSGCTAPKVALTATAFPVCSRWLGGLKAHIRVCMGAGGGAVHLCMLQHIGTRSASSAVSSAVFAVLSTSACSRTALRVPSGLSSARQGCTANVTSYSARFCASSACSVTTVTSAV
jgi:hypothetical protein